MRYYKKPKNRPHSLESSISADTHFLSQSGTTRALSECSLRLSSATRTKCYGTCARRQLQCYHGPDFLKNGTHFLKKRDLKGTFFLEGGHFTRKTDLKGTVFIKKRELLQEKGT